MSNITLFIAVSAQMACMFFVPSAMAEEVPIHIKTDLKGEFFIVEKGGTPQRPTLIVKNTGPGFTNYIKREFDCEAHTMRYLGDGESLDAIAASKPELEMREIREGSISDQLARQVCPKKEAPAEM